MGKRAHVIVLAVFIASLGLTLFLRPEFLPVRQKLSDILLSRLIAAKPLQNEQDREKADAQTLLYVLGGSQTSLNYKFKIAAGLYQSGFSPKITTMSVPGISQYDPKLKRNLTNDEWAIRTLNELGVPLEAIELVTMNEGFFGTLTEAKELKNIVSEGKNTTLILVTSNYHTVRTLLTFSKILHEKKLKFAIYGANEPVYLRSLLYEYMKLLLYREIILRCEN